MTIEERKLLLKDLCARLPYGVIVRHADCIVDGEGNETGNFHYTKGYLYDVCREDDMTTTIIESEGENEGYNHICFLERTIPYLRPMSSMAEEEFVYFMGLKGRMLQSYEIQSMMKEAFNMPNFITIVTQLYDYLHKMDWLLSKHFDVRGLIPKGLAIAVTEENNPYKE